MEEQVGSVNRGIADFDRVQLAAVRTGRLDAPINIERAEDAECIPGAVGIPPTVVRQHTVCGRHRRERVRHPDFVCGRIEDEGMRLMQGTPPFSHRMHIAELPCCRRATELDEGRVGAVAEIEQVRVDPPTLPRPPVLPHAPEIADYAHEL
jgi:hypothetical protein